MITKKIKALFVFIDFLHSKIELCLNQKELFDELHELNRRRNELRPIDNYQKKLSYDEIQMELQVKFSVLEKSIIKPLINKTYELQICNYNDPTTLWNWNIDEIANLKNRFEKKDIPVIKEHKQKYVEFRSTPNNDCYQGMFFSDLDETLKELFDFFKDSRVNEFEEFEAKTIDANSFEEAIHLGIENKNARITIADFLQDGSNNTIRKLRAEAEEEVKESNEKKKEKSKNVQPQTNQSKGDVINFLVEKNQLHTFLSVPAPDILHQNAFWHNENDEAVDCNIYHPKYGYTGFETTSKEAIVTNFNPVTVYQDSETGNYVYCRYFLPMLCTANEKEFTNKDRKKIIKVDYLQTHNTRLAENEQDFDLIYKREFATKNIIETLEARKVFKHELINYVTNLIVVYKERSTYKDRDINMLSLAEQFVVYIDKAEKKVNTNSLTHREIILIHNLKIKAGNEEFKTSSEWEKEGGPKRKQAFYTLDVNNKKKFRKPNQKELKKAIEFLQDDPIAKQIAINNLEELENL